MTLITDFLKAWLGAFMRKACWEGKKRNEFAEWHAV